MDKILLNDGKVGLKGDAFAQAEDEAEWVELRAAWERLGDKRWAKAARAQELANFRRDNTYCGVCGERMEPATEISVKCTGCGREVWPKLSPAIVVLVMRDEGEEALLVNAANFRHRDVYALVAGFVETGETLEECVAREVKEETSLDISDIRYVGSQSWPFPGQMMTGFTARYAGGELRLADGELKGAGWYRRDDPPKLPSQPSLSRRIIDRWINGEFGTKICRKKP